ncbi:hypothetical protein B0H10DRAFT_2196091 [Mycena sp. CBHHK59/15]|nr:hypothetical protein B0H10DRAFT_2196091 [Mycena sp. CBHHK59/15]
MSGGDGAVSTRREKLRRFWCAPSEKRAMIGAHRWQATRIIAENQGKYGSYAKTSVQGVNSRLSSDCVALLNPALTLVPSRKFKFSAFDKACALSGISGSSIQLLFLQNKDDCAKDHHRNCVSSIMARELAHSMRYGQEFRESHDPTFEFSRGPQEEIQAKYKSGYQPSTVTCRSEDGETKVEKSMIKSIRVRSESSVDYGEIHRVEILVSNMNCEDKLWSDMSVHSLPGSAACRPYSFILPNSDVNPRCDSAVGK